MTPQYAPQPQPHGWYPQPGPPPGPRPAPMAAPPPAPVPHQYRPPQQPQPQPQPERPLPSQDLPGPYVREYKPKWPYRHSSSQVASVLYHRYRRSRVVTAEQLENFVLTWFTPAPYTVVDVQLGWHVTEFTMQLPSSDSALFFPARVKVRWQVRDPYKAAQHQVADVGRLMEPELEDRLREVSRKYAVHQVKSANEAVKAELGGAELGRQFGLELELFVDINPDELTVRHTEEVVEARQLTVLERLDHDLKQLKDSGERERLTQWAGHFQQALERGDTEVMAQMMARDPEQLPKIHTMLRREQREARKDSMELIGKLIDGNMLETWQLGDQAQAVVRFLRDGAGRAVEAAGDTTNRVLDAGTSGGSGRSRPFWQRDDDTDESGGAARPAGD